jgi:predicted RND superfamily exporter protein
VDVEVSRDVRLDVRVVVEADVEAENEIGTEVRAVDGIVTVFLEASSVVTGDEVAVIVVVIVVVVLCLAAKFRSSIRYQVSLWSA